MTSPVDYAMVAELHGQGYTAPEIAVRVGCNPRTISRWRVASGVARPLPENAAKPVALERLEAAQRLLDDGASQKEAAITLGMSRDTLRKYFPGRVWTCQQAGAQAQMVRQLNRLEAFAMTEEEQAEARKKRIYELHNRARRLRFEPWQMAVAIRVAEQQQEKASA